ncbi:MAG: hypothetical protein HY900_27960 [Deltaproteobacteria bacterium]|nr:hypothetical protein [Deltaproteobacteria bacterium]
MTRRSFLEKAGVVFAAAAAGGIWQEGRSARAAEAPLELPDGLGGGRVLVVYGTKTGCTRGVAERIATSLAKSGVAVDLAAAESAVVRPDQRGVVVGSGVRVGKWHEPVRSWVADHAVLLRVMPVSFYTVGLRIRNPANADEVRGYTDELIRETGVRPISLGLFAGWNFPERFSFIERMLLKALKVPTGDFRDWKAIEAWAAVIRKDYAERA